MFKMKTEPYAHQQECFDLSKDQKSFAILLEQGLGKTKVALDTAAFLHDRGDIDGLLIVAPNGVHANWILREIPTHMPIENGYTSLLFRSDRIDSQKFKKAWDFLLDYRGLSILSVNVEAVSQSQNAFAVCEKFLKRRKCMMVVDESSRIKTPSATRTKKVIRLGRLAKYRRIMTGTPVTQSPFDLYSQFMFLDPGILGFTSFYTFKHHFGVWEKKVAHQGERLQQYEDLIRYVRLDELKRLVADSSFRRTKNECLDLPPKIYQVVPIRMSPAQEKLYKRLNEEGILEFDDLSLLAPNQLVRLIRLQQVTGGFVPNDEANSEGKRTSGIVQEGVPIPGPNPKLDYLMDALSEDYSGKSIVWARFRLEISAIAEALRKKFGYRSVAELHGGITGKDREESVDRFQSDPTCRFLIGQQQSGIGITLHAADNVFYFSNSFSYEQRYQSEDRAHRIGLDHSVVYVDLTMEGTVDEKVRQVLLSTKRVADSVTEGRTA